LLRKSPCAEKEKMPVRLGKTQRSFQKKKADDNALAELVTYCCAKSMANAVPILTEDKAMILLRFLSISKWSHISKSWLFLMEDWLEAEDKFKKRSFNLDEELDRLGTVGPSKKKLRRFAERRLNASPDFGKHLEKYMDLKDDVRRFCRMDPRPPADPAWCAELHRQANERLLEMGVTPLNSEDSESD
jgi:hypothetical protein